MTLVYVAIAWAAGTWLARLAWLAGWIDCRAPGPLAWAGLLALPLAGFVVGRTRPRWRLPAALLLFLLLGAWRYQRHPFEPCFTSADLAYYNSSAEDPAWATVIGVVQRPPEARDTRVRVRLRAERLIRSGAGQDEQIEIPIRGDALFTVDRYPELRYGDRVAVRGRLEVPPEFEDFSYRDYLARQGVHTLVQRPEVRVLARGGGSPFWRALYALREAGQRTIAQLLPEPESALLNGIVLGIETGIDPALYDQFNQTGVSHIIVISGFNITIVAGLLTAIFGRLVGKRRAFFPVVAGIVLYTLLVGAEAAVTRAALMGLLVALAAYLNRRGVAIVSLFAAGLLMAVLNPLTLWDVGFQLSFMATLSLLLFTEPLTGWFERIVGGGGSRETRRQGNKASGSDVQAPPGIHAVGHALMGFLNDALIVTLAASVLTMPMIAYYFGRVSIVSPLTNLLVLPPQPYVMIWGGAAMIAGLLGSLPGPLAALHTVLWPLARLLALIPWLGLHWTVLVVQALAGLPFASLDVQLGPAALAGYYVALALLVSRRSLPVLGPTLERLRGWLGSSAATTAAAGGVVVTGALLLFALRSQPDGRLHVHFLDVGRGEAILVQTPNGQQVLIDGGFSPTALTGALGNHMPFYDRQIELVVVTHPGDERIGGLVSLPGRYAIKQVLQAPFPYPSAAYESWLRTLHEHNVPVVTAETGVRVDLGYGATLDVLSPTAEPALSKNGEPDLNANSVVLRLAWGETSFLLLGDASKAVQDALAASGLVRPASVVKVPQGGKQAAFSPALLDAAQPQHAVVFAQAEDRFRDLSAGVEESLKTQVGAAGWHRTDLEGTVSFTSDGHEVKASSLR